MLYKTFRYCLFALCLVVFHGVNASAGIALFDPYVYVTNETDQPFNLEWEIAKVKPGKKPIVFGTDKVKVAAHTENAKVGKFDWLERAGKNGVDINKVIVKVFDAKNHLLYQQTEVKEHLFVGADAQLNKKLNLFVNISADHKVSIRVSEK